MAILSEKVAKVKEKTEVPSSQEIIDDLVNRKPAQNILNKTKHKTGIIVEGVGDLMTHMAKCCQPIPGDEILGFVTQGRGISVHRKDCEKLKRMMTLFPERVVDASWGDSALNGESGYTVTIRVIGPDYSGFLRDVTTVLANDKLNVLGVRSHVDKAKDLSLVDIDLVVVSIPVLNRTMAKLQDLPYVSEAKRL